MKNDPNKNGMTYASHTHTRDGNVCEAYVIPFLFGSFFTVCHPYIDLHFVKCFLCYLFLPFLGGSKLFLIHHGVSCCSLVWSCGEVCRVSLSHKSGDTSRPEHAARAKVGFN